MTPAEARERMHDALDGELSEADKRDFDRVLASDAALRAEYETLTRLLNETRSLASEPKAAQVDLLSGVQQRLRERSGGRFYRDRFAEVRGRGASVVWMLALALIVVIAVGTWLLFDAGVFAKP